MKFDVLHNFISPVTGRIRADEDYIVVGNSNQWADPSPILIDMRLDIINLRRDVNSIFDTSFITTFPDDNYPNAQVLSNLDDGFLYNTDGILSTNADLPYAPSDAKYILQEANDNLPNAQDLSDLGGGILKTDALSKGAISIASGGKVPGVNDYVQPIDLIDEISALETSLQAEIAAAEASAIATSFAAFTAEMLPYIPALPPEQPITIGAQIVASIAAAEVASNAYTDTQILAINNTITTYQGDVEGQGKIGDIINLTFTPNPEFTGKQSMTIPVGTIAERPASPELGMLRFNTDLNKPEYYSGLQDTNLQWLDVWDSGGVCNINTTEINYNWKIDNTVLNVIHNLEGANAQTLVETVVAGAGTAEVRTTAVIQSAGFGFVENNRYAVVFTPPNSPSIIPFDIFYDGLDNYKLTTKFKAKLDIDNNLISNVQNPLQPQDAATKTYVDNQAIMHSNVSVRYTDASSIGDHVKFDNILFSTGNGITLDTNSPYSNIVDANVASVGRIELAEGRIYKLTGSLSPIDGNNDIALVQWYRITDTSEFAIGSDALFSDKHGSTGPAVAYVDLINDIPVGNKTIYELRITNGFGGIDNEGSLPWFTIETII